MPRKPYQRAPHRVGDGRMTDDSRGRGVEGYRFFYCLFLYIHAGHRVSIQKLRLGPRFPQEFTVLIAHLLPPCGAYRDGVGGALERD